MSEGGEPIRIRNIKLARSLTATTIHKAKENSCQIETLTIRMQFVFKIIKVVLRLCCLNLLIDLVPGRYDKV